MGGGMEVLAMRTTVVEAPWGLSRTLLSASGDQGGEAAAGIAKWIKRVVGGCGQETFAAMSVVCSPPAAYRGVVGLNTEKKRENLDDAMRLG